MGLKLKSKPISELEYIKWDPEKVVYAFSQGNETCAESAVLAGCDFFGGYPITPSSEIAEVLSRRMPQEGRVFVQMEDEIASMASIIGASLGGARTMTATSGPGFSLMQENLGYAITTEIPCVIVNVQRLGPSTGGPTSPSQSDYMQVKWGTHGDHPIIALSPSTIQEVMELTIVSFDFAERYRTPVILLMDEVTGHMREKVGYPRQEDISIFTRSNELPESGDYKPYDLSVKSGVPPLISFGEGVRYHVTGLIHDEYGFPTRNRKEIRDWYDRIYRKIDNGLDRILRYDLYNLEDADTVIISFGISARTGLEAMIQARKKGRKVGMVKLLTLVPLPEEMLKEVIANVDRVIIPEMNRGQLILDIERLNKKGIDIIPVNRYDGEIISPGDVLDAIGGC
ncbi:MAG: 2-oxoacid:acceptor oxidoreductase subunit alpha [Candidatus Eremiobacteraeota bacterium]|nr:2-oxoacid:acceptor oxidoreductase subunit alpha [Candidatus Eremiobacteraeota bacterium]